MPAVPKINHFHPTKRLEGSMKTREYLAIKRRIDDFELSEQLTRTKLMQGAKAGDVTALSLLRQRYGLRLPLVEDTIKVPLPWRRTNGN
jgi:hypothetical protein